MQLLYLIKIISNNGDLVAEAYSKIGDCYFFPAQIIVEENAKLAIDDPKYNENENKIGIYGICSHTSYPHIHELLLHTDTVLKPYPLIECLEREVFDERYTVYLYIIDLCTELDGLGFLASDDGTYIMTVNADDAVTDFPPFKHFLFLYKHLSDDGKTLMVILCISE